MAYAFNDDKSKVEVYTKEEAYSKEEIIISTEPAPETGNPNTIYIQIVEE
jgi:hypothetical protein